MTRRSITTRLTWLIPLLVLIPVQGAAQDTEAPIAENTVAPEPTGPIAIPQAEIPTRADELSINLRRLETLLTRRRDDVSLEEPTDRLLALRIQLESLEVDFLSTARLEDHRLEWQSLKSIFDRLADQLGGRWAALDQARQELERARRQWEATLETAASEEAPPEILLRLTGILETIDDVDAQVSQRRDAVAALLQRVTDEREVVAEGIAQIDAMAGSIRRRLLTRDASPLWEPAGSSGASLGQDARDGVAYWFDSLSSFISKNPERLYAWTSLFFLFLGLTLTLKRWSKIWPAEERDLDPARFVVSRPISAALALALAFIAAFIQSATTSVHDMIALLALIPVLRLGLGLLDRRARPALFGMLGFYVLNIFWWLAPDGSLLRRLGLLLATAAALGGAAYLLARWRGQTGTSSAAWRAARIGVRFAGLMLAVSLIANILGWSTLAQTLTDAISETAYAAVAWIVVVLVARSLIALVPRSFMANIFISVRRNETAFLRYSTRLIALVAFLVWTRGALARFQMLEHLSNGVTTALSSSVSIGGLQISAGRVLAGLALLFLTWLGARFVRFVLTEEILPRLRLPPGADHSVTTLSNYVFWGGGLALAAAAVGLTGTQLTVAVGALGVGIGFGLQNIISNFVSGLILIFERPIRVGDRVQTSAYMGVVTGIGIRACTIRTYDGAEVVVPNGDLIAKEFINWTHTDETRRVELNIRVAYGTDPRKVLEILTRVASEHPQALENPAPSAFMVGFGESSLDFRLWVWSRIQDFISLSSDLHVAVSEALKEEGIEIPLPQRDVNLRAVSSEDAPVPPTGLPLSEETIER